MLCALCHLIFTRTPPGRVYYCFYFQTKDSKNKSWKPGRGSQPGGDNTCMWVSVVVVAQACADSGVRGQLNKPAGKAGQTRQVRPGRAWRTIWHHTGRKRQLVAHELVREFSCRLLFLRVVVYLRKENQLLSKSEKREMEWFICTRRYWALWEVKFS